MDNIDDKRSSLKNDKVFWFAFAAGIVLMLIFILFYTLICPDAANYYARMVREFGAGRYEFAFDPIIPPLLIIFAGTVAKLGIEAYLSIKFICAIFFILGLFPLRFIMRRILPEKLASWACVAYIISPYIVRNVIIGVPFSLKMFFLLLSTYLVIKFAEKRNIIFAFILGLSLGLLALSRGEGIAFLPFFILWFLFLPLLPGYRKSNYCLEYRGCKKDKYKIIFVLKKQFIGFLAIIITFAAICLPQMVYIYNITGIPLTEHRVAGIFRTKVKKIFSIDLPVKPTTKVNLKPQLTSQAQSEKQTKIIPQIQKQSVSLDITKQLHSADIFNLKRSLSEAVKGMYPFFLILVFFGLFWKFYERKFSILDLFCATVILYNAGIYIFTIGVLDYRYTAVALPFELGWVVLGGYFIYSWKLFSPQVWKRLMKIILMVVIFVLFFDCTKYLQKQLIHGNSPLVVGMWIDNNRDEFLSTNKISNYKYYRTDRLPVIFSNNPCYAYWAKGDWLLLSENYHYQRLLDVMKRHNASVLINDGDLRIYTPEFHNNWKNDFIVVKDFKKQGITVLRLKTE